MKTISKIVLLFVLASFLMVQSNTLLAQPLLNRYLQTTVTTPPLLITSNFTKNLANNLKKQELLFDGLGNNVANPTFNTPGSSFRRLINAAFPDGISEPISDRPSARVISNDVGALIGTVPVDKDGLSALFTMWGQFLDHDLDLSNSQPIDPVVQPVDISIYGGGTTPSVTPAQFFNINVPAYDQTFGPNSPLDPSDTSPNALGTVQINFIRSIFSPNQVPRISTQHVTGWHDASQVYGSTKQKSDELRSFVDGKLKVNNPKDVKGFLPKDATGFFVAGDVRANQNVLLTIIHTIWLRQHNRLCDEIKLWDKSSTLTDNEIYTIARVIVTGLISKITFFDWLPRLIGPKLHTHFFGEYQDGDYDSLLDARIPIQFSNAAFRIGHPLLVSSYPQINPSGVTVSTSKLADLFSNPQFLTNDTVLENLLRGIAKIGAKEKNCNVVDDVRNLLILGPSGSDSKPITVDLFSLNVQRGRQTGIPSYTELRTKLGFAPVSSFSDVTDDKDSAAKLELTYGDVSLLDPWVGIICQTPLPGAVMGRIGAEIVARTFQSLRYGDRLWYEKVLPDYIKTYIKGTTFKHVIQRNTGITGLQPNVFLAK